MLKTVSSLLIGLAAGVWFFLVGGHLFIVSIFGDLEQPSKLLLAFFGIWCGVAVAAGARAVIDILSAPKVEPPPSVGG